LWVNHVESRELEQRRWRPLVENEVIFYLRNSRLLDLHSNQVTLKMCSGLNIQIRNDGVQFQFEIEKISRRRPRLVDVAEFGHFTFLFCRGRQRNVQKRTCTAIVLLIKPFVLRRFRCYRGRGLLKLPNSLI